MLEIKNITKVFGDGKANKVAVDNISLNLESGTFAAIVGPSGSGKSTLLTMMGGLQSPTEGNIFLEDTDLYGTTEKERSDIRFRKLGFVLQGSNLVPFLTIESQFQLKLGKVNLKKHSLYNKLMKKLQIEDLKGKYPDEISGGERQRVAIALSLILEPKIILADEPTASLDTEKAYSVVKLLKDITKTMNTIVVMVTHDTRMLVDCDRVFEITDGKLRELSVDSN